MARIVDRIVMDAKRVMSDNGYDTEKNFPLVDRSFTYTYNDLRELQKTSKRRKSAIVDIEQVSSKLIPPYCKVMSFKTNGIMFEDKYGMFVIKLKNGKFGVYARWETGSGKVKFVDSFLMGDKEFLSYIYSLSVKRKKQQEKPKLGIYKTQVIQGVVLYKKYNPETSTVIHPVVDVMERSVTRHFTRLKERKYHDRTAMLYSCAGTGKTEFLKNLAQKYKNTHSIVFVSGVQDMIFHQRLSTKYKIPTIIILEEAEEAFMQVSGNYGIANSSVKNILSGYLTEKNKGGCYKIFTTNHPNRIANTITDRRGRIDEFQEFGKLKGDYSYECAELYLGKDVISKLDRDKIINSFNDMTGVDIKYNCETAIEYAEANELNISNELIDNIVSNRNDDIKKMRDFKGDIYDGVGESDKVGFGKTPMPSKTEQFDFENF